MSVRIYELAREFDMVNKEVIEICQQAGLQVKSHSSTIDEDEADMIRRRLAARLGAEDDDLDVEPEPEPAAPVAVAAVPAPPEEEVPPELSPEEQLAQARQRVVALPTRGRAKPKAEGVKLPGRRKPPARRPPSAPGAEAAVAEEAPAAEAPAEAAAEAPPAEAPAEAAPAAPAEIAPAEVPAEAPPAEAPAAPPAEAAEAAAAETAEAAPVEAPEAPEAPAPPAERPVVRRRPPRPGPKLAPRPRQKPAPGPKLAPKPTRPDAHPQKVTEEAPPAPHPQAVGIGAGKKTRPPARPKKGKQAGKVDQEMQAEMEAVAKKGAPGRRGRRRGRRGEEGEQAEGVRRAQAFRRRERSRQREDVDEIAADGDRAGGMPAMTERGRRGARRLVPRAPRRPAVRPAEGPRKAVVVTPVSVKSLSAALGIKASDIIKHLMMQGQMATINDTLSEEQAAEVALAFDIDLAVRAEREPAQVIEDIEGREDTAEALQPRPPIVTFLGHVDHGKTSLMDTIRQTHVAEGEAGGITQHIGAYRVPVGERWVTFLDTPGHEAFTAMRARGAQVTDVVVLVVAADDGVMPQTEEAVNHAKAAEVPIVVAINKCDLPTGNPDRVRQQLTQYELLDEKWGGQTICVETSAVSGQNVDQLLESLLLEAEILELKANPDREALGTVIEAELTEGMGPMATLLVRSGTLRPGDIVLAGTAYGRVRVMSDETGKELDEAGPTVPVRVAGLSDVPEAGDSFYVLEDLAVAKELAGDRQRRSREAELAEQRRPRTLEAVFEQMTEQKVEELPVVLKADVHGSLGALRENLEKIEHPEVRVRVIHGGVGGINESDILLADASDAIVIGFNVVPDSGARALAEDRGVDIRQYNVIYHVTEDVRKALEGLLAPEEEERRLGEAEVLQTFKISRVGTIAGCRVTDGTLARSARIRVVRDGLVVYEGKLDSLKRVKDDVRECRAGQECGLHIQGFDDVKVGDRVEAFEVVSIARTL